MHALIAAIPSPSSNAIEVGPMHLRAYGAFIGLGVLVAVWMARRRWAGRGGNPDDVSTIAIWAVPAGVLGARAWHVITQPDLFKGRWHEAFYFWRPGLGIPGGVLAGTVTGILVARHLKLPVRPLLDCVAPAIPAAQAIGRLGNYFNQELYGRPTTLPWALKIDPAIVARDHPELVGKTFHPTFLYEMLWNLAVVGTLLLIERRRHLRLGHLFALYVGLYGLGRLWVESLRIDDANHILGLRVNTWTSLVLIGGSVAFLVIDSRRPVPATAATGPLEPYPDDAVEDDAVEDDALADDALADGDLGPGDDPVPGDHLVTSDDLGPADDPAPSTRLEPGDDLVAGDDVGPSISGEASEADPGDRADTGSAGGHGTGAAAAQGADPSPADPSPADPSPAATDGADPSPADPSPAKRS